MRKAKELLETLTNLVTPGENQRHCITLDDDGNLEVSLMRGDWYQSFTIEESDFDLTSKELAASLANIIGDHDGER